MKKALIAALSALMCFVMISCDNAQGGDNVKNNKPGTKVAFINEVEEADIWILPNTEENMKSSLWGTATFPKLKKGEKASAEVDDEGTGNFIIKIIDSDHAYYSAEQLILGDGYTIRFHTDDSSLDASLTVSDENGRETDTRDNVFVGMLGAR